MDPKRRKIYIIAFVASLVVAVGILIWSKTSSPSVPELSTPAPLANIPASATPTTTTTPKINIEPNFVAPAVFPQNNNLDSSVLSQLKLLQTFDPVKVDSKELGRDNPFNNF